MARPIRFATDRVLPTLTGNETDKETLEKLSNKSIGDGK